MKHRAVYSSPIGKLNLICDDENLLALLFENPKHHASLLLDVLEIKPGFHSPIIDKTCMWLDRYFSGDKNVSPDDLPLSPAGSDFAHSVWKVLLDIPYGGQMTYGEVASRIGCNSAQAVGQAIGRNRIAIIIPCHRVIGADGSLTGFAGGLDIKKELLAHEHFYLTSSKEESSD
jgi:methylated-DNA-[protein]-cysteine S-methyltransferase